MTDPTTQVIKVVLLATEVLNRAQDECDWSAEDVFSSMAPDPTSDIFRGPCTPIV
jgi:hypothetical protein